MNTIFMPTLVHHLAMSKYLSTAVFSPALQVLLQSRNRVWKREMDSALLLALSVYQFSLIWQYLSKVEEAQNAKSDFLTSQSLWWWKLNLSFRWVAKQYNWKQGILKTLTLKILKNFLILYALKKSRMDSFQLL